MTQSTISFRAPTDKRETLDSIAKSQQRDRSFIINEALDRYIDIYNWQIAHIQQGIEQAENGDFVSHEDVMAKMDRMRKQCK